MVPNRDAYGCELAVGDFVAAINADLRGEITGFDAGGDPVVILDESSRYFSRSIATLYACVVQRQSVVDCLASLA